jgi:hypothetical protein
MLWWIVPVFLIVLLAGFVLFTPFFVGIDSSTGYAGIRFGRLIEATLLFNETLQVVRVKIAWWRKEFDLFQSAKPVTPVQHEKAVRKRKTRKAIPLAKLLRKVRAVLSTFRITRCFITIDTGDMRVNGILYPWVYLLKRRIRKNVSINFWGENVVILEAKNTIARMLWAYVKS